MDALEQTPTWRAAAHRFLAPYRRAITVLVLPILLVSLLNSLFDWGLFGGYDRKAQGVAMLVGLLWYVFVAPSHDELRELRDRRRAVARRDIRRRGSSWTQSVGISWFAA